MRTQVRCEEWLHSEHVMVRFARFILPHAAHTISSLAVAPWLGGSAGSTRMPASMQRRIRQGAQVVRLPRVSRQLPPREQAVGEGLVMLCRRKNSRHGRHEETPFLALVAALSPHTTQPVW